MAGRPHRRTIKNHVKIIWTCADQIALIQRHGFMIGLWQDIPNRSWTKRMREPEPRMNRAGPVPLLDGLTNDQCREIIAHGTFHCDALLVKAYNFIRQQARYDLAGAWEGRCGFFNPMTKTQQLRWARSASAEVRAHNDAVLRYRYGRRKPLVAHSK